MRSKLSTIVYLVFFLFLYSGSILSQNPVHFIDSKTLDINYIHLPFNNYGYLHLNQEPLPGWHHYGYEQILYQQGLFFIGKINEDVRLRQVVWSSMYSPGPIIDEKPAMTANINDSLKYRVFKISKGDSSSNNIDVRDWPVSWAPLTENKRIKLYADQMLWMTYNGLDSGRSTFARTFFDPMPIEVQQYIYAYKTGTQDPFDFLEDVVFQEFLVINKGIEKIDSAYIGLWTDIDFNGENNFPAIDTSLQLGYCWSNFTGAPSFKDSSIIPAVGYVQLYGPAVESEGDSAVFNGEIKDNYKNKNLSSFWGFHDDSFFDTSSLGPAYSIETAWNIARGLNKLGNDIIDPYTGLKTSFRYAGDPVTNSGWLAPGHTSGGAGFYMFTGPFNLAPNDSQWVMFAFIAARGGDNLKSVTELRRRANILRNTGYPDLVRFSEIKIADSIEITIPSEFILSQNYPNPFNNGTIIEYNLPENLPARIELFNILGERVATLVNEEKNAGLHRIIFNAANLPGGVYFYRLNAGAYTSTKKMILLR